MSEGCCPDKKAELTEKNNWRRPKEQPQQFILPFQSEKQETVPVLHILEERDFPRVTQQYMVWSPSCQDPTKSSPHYITEEMPHSVL